MLCRKRPNTGGDGQRQGGENEAKGLRTVVVNTDFAEQAVERGRQTESAKKGEVRWEKMDLLNWRDIESLRDETEAGVGKIFDFVVDKSTSDAISCGPGVPFSQETLTCSPEEFHPLIPLCVAKAPSKILTLDPLEVLALHLASLVRPGGLWVALSYSSHRFPFLVSPTERRLGSQDLVDVAGYWAVDVVKEVDTPSGWGKQGNVFAPDIKHHLYIFRRTDKMFEL